MGWFVDSQATYTRKIHDPDTKEEGWVKLRPLGAGDRAYLTDASAMQAMEAEGADGEEEMRVRVKAGTMQLLTLEAAIIEWSIPSPPTKETIHALHPDVFDEIFEHVTYGSIPEEPEEGKSDPLPGQNSSSGKKSAELAAASS